MGVSASGGETQKRAQPDSTPIQFPLITCALLPDLRHIRLRGRGESQAVGVRVTTADPILSRMNVFQHDTNTSRHSVLLTRVVAVVDSLWRRAAEQRAVHGGRVDEADLL